MPVKNAEPYLRECIHSIINQSFKDWQLVVVDDSSTDRSYTILRDFAESYSNIYVTKSKGEGIIAALQQAYNLCNGNFIHRMDADDIMPLNKLELLRKNWQEGAVVTGKIKYFINGGEIGEGFSNYQNWINNLMDANNIWKDPYLECSIPSSAWLMSRADFDSIGGFNSDILPEDYDLMFRIYKSGLKIIALREVIHLWRDSGTRTSRNNPAYFPIAYYPIKVHYFLNSDRNNKPLLLWGAGKKGKIIAKLLKVRGVNFTWATNNTNKIGHKIYNVKMQSITKLNLDDYQIIIAVSSPKDKLIISEMLRNIIKTQSKDYFWFS